MRKGSYIGILAVSILFLAAGETRATEAFEMNRLPEPTAGKLPRWRGFNLLEKFVADHSGPFVETDFQWISDWGFNFVRLPMSYLCWIKDGDWRSFNEDVLKEIDQAVEWGRKYSVHVCINFHRGPGYCVNPPKEPKDLWTDPEAQEVCALHWATFARRYKGIPNRNLSFDLLNEPSDIATQEYAKVAAMLVEAIRREDPERLIISDGTRWGNEPVFELAGLGIAQSTRGYNPFWISHYKASWINHSGPWPVPAWPRYDAFNSYLHSKTKADLFSPLVIKTRLSRETLMRIRINAVSSRALLSVSADKRPVFEKEFVSGPGEGEWKEVRFREEYGIYQNVYDREYEFRLPKGTKEIRAEVLEGDWLTVSEIQLEPFPGAPGEKAAFGPTSTEWGGKQSVLSLDKTGRPIPRKKGAAFDGKTLWRESIEPWKKLEEAGVGIHVGEWGAFNHTPHDVTLAWMKDCLKNWKRAGWGWALWNFRGSFGVLDSGRKDVEYEDYKGHKLDRKMLKLLQSW